METVVCKICGEAGLNFLCMQCVGKDVADFLPKPMRKGFGGFHRAFSLTLSSGPMQNDAVACLNCRSTQESPICPECYAEEVSSWLEERSPAVAKKFLKTFSFDTRESETVEEEGFGICDECGDYGEDLVFADGEWMCHECSANITE